MTVVFPLLGIPALVYAVLAEVCVIRRDFARADRYADKASWLAMSGVISLVMLVLICFVYFSR
jgi:hypothetical protein